MDWVFSSLGQAVVVGGCLLLLFTAAVASPHPAEAQQSGARPYRVHAGDYDITVFSNASTLSLGTVDYIIVVAEPGGGPPITDAHVLIHAEHVAEEDQSQAIAENKVEGHKGQAIALHVPDKPGRYTARVELDRAGVWEMAVEVNSDRGRVQVGTASHVVPTPRQSTAGGLVFIGVFTVLVLGVLYLVWSSRKALRQRELTGAG